jgi:hypothetical protein
MLETGASLELLAKIVEPIVTGTPNAQTVPKRPDD